MNIRIIPISLLFFTILNFSKAEESIKTISSDFEVEAIQAKRYQMSCKHLNLLRKHEKDNFSKFLNVADSMNEDQLKAYIEFLEAAHKVKNHEILNQRTHHISYVTSSTDENTWIQESENTALISNDYFDFQLANGGHRFKNLSIRKNSNGSHKIDFDITQLDLCVNQSVELLFFSDCPLERVRFDTCNYVDGVCTGQPYWESKAFVLEFKSCKKKNILKFDLSELAKKHGVRDLQ